MAKEKEEVTVKETVVARGPCTVVTRELLESLGACCVDPDADEEDQKLVARLPAPLVDVVKCNEGNNDYVEWLLARVDPDSLTEASVRLLRWAVRSAECTNKSAHTLIRPAVRCALRDLHLARVSALQVYCEACLAPDRYDSAVYSISREDILDAVQDIQEAVSATLSGRTQDVIRSADAIVSEAFRLSGLRWNECETKIRGLYIQVVRRRARKEEEA